MATGNVIQSGWSPEMNERFKRIGLGEINLDPSLFCIDSRYANGKMCVTFPGGAEVCISAGDMDHLPNAGEMASELLGRVNSAMTPMVPFFNILDAVLAVIECTKSLPDAITSLDPRPIMDCLKKLVPLAAKLAEMSPLVTIPKMVIQIIDVLIAALIGVREEILDLVSLQARINDAYDKAERTGNVHLAAIADCKNADLKLHLEFISSRLAPLNRMLSLLAQLLDIAGVKVPVGCISLDTSGTEPVEYLLTPIDALIYLLYVLRGQIPGLSFPIFGGGADETCKPENAFSIGKPAAGPTQDPAELRKRLEEMIPGIDMKELGFG